MRRSVEGISKRLEQAEMQSKRGSDRVRISYTSAAKATAQTLTGVYLRTPTKVELSWGDAESRPASDRQKIKWLRQYNPNQIDEFRATWERSACSRDRAALAELSRLLPMLEQ
jgi:hypothetical protein